MWCVPPGLWWLLASEPSRDGTGHDASLAPFGLSAGRRARLSWLSQILHTGRERQLRYFDGRRARQNVRGTARQAGDGT